MGEITRPQSPLKHPGSRLDVRWLTLRCHPRVCKQRAAYTVVMRRRSNSAGYFYGFRHVYAGSQEDAAPISGTSASVRAVARMPSCDLRPVWVCEHPCWLVGCGCAIYCCPFVMKCCAENLQFNTTHQLCFQCQHHICGLHTLVNNHHSNNVLQLVPQSPQATAVCISTLMQY